MHPEQSTMAWNFTQELSIEYFPNNLISNSRIRKSKLPWPHSYENLFLLAKSSIIANSFFMCCKNVQSTFMRTISSLHSLEVSLIWSRKFRPKILMELGCLKTSSVFLLYMRLLSRQKCLRDFYNCLSNKLWTSCVNVLSYLEREGF